MLNEKVASKREGSWLDGIGEMIKARERERKVSVYPEIRARKEMEE
jgi:hypothetical protein